MDKEKTPEELAAEDEKWADQAMRQSELFYALKPDIARLAKKRVPPQYVRLVDTRDDNEVHEEDDEKTAENRQRWKQSEEDEKRRSLHWFRLLFVVLVVLPGLAQLTGLYNVGFVNAVFPGLLLLAGPLLLDALDGSRNH